MEITSQHPLVSVAVIAYNSAEYILETLESIKAQTYDNIELIVSDDCSTDGTVEICRKWIENNKSRFVDARIVESPVNTGQSGNYNRAFDACKGEWIKEIDGDDRLLPHCISDFIEFTHTHPEAQCIFGKIQYIGGTPELRDIYLREHFDYDFFSLPKEKQFRRLLLNGNCIPSPGYFYNKSYIQHMGVTNDERIPHLEDYPKWINLLKKGVTFFFMDQFVAEYRLGSGVSTQNKISPLSYKSLQLFKIYYLYPELIAMGEEERINHEAAELANVYAQKLSAEHARESLSYRIGRCILSPLRQISKCFHR